MARASFLSGLVKVDTGRAPWRPRAVYHYIQDYDRTADVVVDVTGHLDTEMKAIAPTRANSTTPIPRAETPISSRGFMEHVRRRATSFGRPVGVDAGGVRVRRPVGTDSLLDLI